MNILRLSFILVFAAFSFAGTWTTNNYLYKPSQGEYGTTSKQNFDTGFNRVDAKLASTALVGDPLYPTLSAAIGSLNLSGTPTTLTVSAGTHTLSADLTVNSNIDLRFNRGAVISIPTGKTLTINGTLTAGFYQIFSCAGTGKVTFASGSIREVLPQWFGATGNGTTDDTAALISSSTSTPVGGVIYMAPGVYKTTGWLITKSISIVANGPFMYGASAATTLKAAGAQAYVLKLQGVYAADASTFIRPYLRNINVDADNKTISDAAFIMEYCHLSHLEGCSFQNADGHGIRMRTMWELRMRDFFILNCGSLDTGSAFFIDGPAPLDVTKGCSNVSIQGGIWGANKGRLFQVSSLANIDGLWFDNNKLEVDTINMNTVDTNVIHMGSISRGSISNNTFATFGATAGKYANLIWIGGVNDDGSNGAPGGPGNIIVNNRYIGLVASGAINGLSLAANAAPVYEDNNQAYTVDPTVLSVPNVNASIYRQFIKRSFKSYGSTFYTQLTTPSIEHPGFISIHEIPAANANIPTFVASASPKDCLNNSNTAARFTTAGLTSFIAHSFDLSRWIGHADSHLVIRARMRLDAAGDVTVFANPTAPGAWTAVPHGVASQNWEWCEFIVRTSELSSTDHLLDMLFYAINNGTPKLLVDGLEFKTDNMVEETVTVGSPILLVSGIVPRIVNIDSSGGAVNATLPDGADIGQRIIIRMTNATTSSTVSVTHHVTFDPEVFTFATLGATVELRWDGTDWATVYNHGATL